MRLWSLLRGEKAETRSDSTISLDQWAEMFKYKGNLYPFGLNMPQRGGKSEEIGEDFASLVTGAYKACGPVFACSLARQTVFTEMRFAWQEISDGRPGDLFQARGLELLDSPWPNGSTGELLSRMIQDADFAGNAFVVREDGPGGTRLRRLRPDWVTIVLTADPEEALKSDVAAYVFRPGNTDNKDRWEIFPADGSNGAVAHWSPIPDPEAQYRGMSWLTPIIREIAADKQISKHKLKFFENAAVPNLAISVDPSMSKEDFKEFVEAINQNKVGTDHAYENLYLGGGADVTVVGANIDQIDFKSISGVGETRIAAAARVHPALVGLSEGMQGATLNEGNYSAARDNFADGTIRPLWRSLCSALSVLVDVPPNSRLWYDDRDIAFLLEDRQKAATYQQTEAETMANLVMNGWQPDSVIEAVRQADWRLLKHTGLYSVQLLPPNISNPQEWGDKNKNGVNDFEEQQAKKEQQKKQSGSSPRVTGTGQSQANNHPTGSKRKPVGRPTNENKTSLDPEAEFRAAWEEAENVSGNS